MGPRPDDEHDEQPGSDEEAPGQVEEQAQEMAQEEVRRLLAAATPADRAMPEDVASRLDDVLADLVRQHAADPAGTSPDTSADTADSTGPGEGPDSGTHNGPLPAGEVAGVTELASRRRRWRPRLLVAAAAVSVLALGVGVSLDELTGRDGEAASTAGSAGGLAGPEDRADSRLLESQKAPPPPTSGLPEPSGRTDLSRDTRLPTLRRAHLAADLQRVEDARLAVPVNPGSRLWREACVHPDTVRGDTWLPVRLDGRRAVLVLRAPDRGRRTAEVFTCDSADTPAASATLEAR